MTVPKVPIVPDVPGLQRFKVQGPDGGSKFKVQGNAESGQIVPPLTNYWGPFH